MITLQFSNTKGLISKMVQFRTWSWASHVDFILPDGQLLGASWKQGVALRDNKRSDYDRVERYEAEGDESILISAMEKIGSGYDFPGIMGFVIRKEMQDKDSWFCSEFIASEFGKVGKPLLNTDVDYSKLSPSQLLLSPHLKRIN